MANFRKVSEDFFYEILESYFVYKDSITSVRFSRNKFTGEVKMDANDCARCLGFGSINDLLGTDNGLDAINKWLKDNPGKQVFGKDGSGSMFEEAGNRFYDYFCSDLSKIEGK